MEFLQTYAILTLLAFMLLLIIGYSTCICIKWFKEKIQTVLMISDWSAYVISMSCVVLSYYFFNLLAGILYFFCWITIKIYAYQNECNDFSYGLEVDDQDCSSDGDCSSD